MSYDRSKELQLSGEENREIAESLEKIRQVLKRRNINIKNVIGLVTADQVEETAKQVEIRFAEKTEMNVVMNMVAFD